MIMTTNRILIISEIYMNNNKIFRKKLKKKNCWRKRRNKKIVEINFKMSIIIMSTIKKIEMKNK